MENLETGDKVKWIEPMMCVPHPEGKTDIVIRGNSFSNVATVRPDGMNLPKDMPTYYDKQVKSENLIKI